MPDSSYELDSIAARIAASKRVEPRSVAELDSVTRGMPIGINDRDGVQICVGDVLEFDEREWGNSSTRFLIEIRDGQIVGNGTPSDWKNWCRVIHKAYRGDSGHSEAAPTQSPYIPTF
jgi:hypothetical protein